ncbi:MAG TPA: hypothetical protein VII47_03950, partial [Actinomycetota bacterium]
RLEPVPPPVVSPAEIRAALTDATNAGKRLAPALKVLERGLNKASPARTAQYAPHLTMLHARVAALADEMRTVRLWSLEMAHFLESWHPIGPSFGPPDGR